MRSSTASPSQWFIDWVHGGDECSAGVSVTEDSALKYTPFWSAVRCISGSVASLPLITYTRKGEGKERADSHRVYNLLHNRPNDHMDAVTFLETRMANALVYGNGYAEIQRDGAGRPLALWPLLPNKTERKMSPGGVPYYEVTTNDGPVPITDYNVLHIKGLGPDGYSGYNVAAYHKEAIGVGVAIKKYGGKFFGNGAQPGGVLEHPGQLTDTAAKRLRESWQSVHGGLDNAHRIAILEEGMGWKQMGVDPEKSQCLEMQKFSVADVSRIFNIPPHKLGDLDRATFSNIEQQSIEFVTTTLFYWFRKWEQECNYKLFLPGERDKFFVEFLVDAFLRGDTEARTKSYTAGRQGGWLSINDVRRMENLNPIGPEGDKYMEPLNMKPAGEEPPQQKPPDKTTTDDDGDADDTRTWDAHYRVVSDTCGRVLRAASKREDDAANEDFATKILSPVLMAWSATLGAHYASLEDEYCRMAAAIPDASTAEEWAVELMTKVKEIAQGCQNAN